MTGSKEARPGTQRNSALTQAPVRQDRAGRFYFTKDPRRQPGLDGATQHSSVRASCHLAESCAHLFQIMVILQMANFSNTNGGCARQSWR